MEGTSQDCLVQHPCLKQGQVDKLVSLYLSWSFEKQSWKYFSLTDSCSKEEVDKACTMFIYHDSKKCRLFCKQISL